MKQGVYQLEAPHLRRPSDASALFPVLDGGDDAGGEASIAVAGAWTLRVQIAESSVLILGRWQ